ncbi:hypothetical protein GcM3_148009, partial [Golovinomyces cichoracearum]
MPSSLPIFRWLQEKAVTPATPPVLVSHQRDLECFKIPRLPWSVYWDWTQIFTIQGQ